MKKQVKIWISIAFSYVCGIVYPFILANAMNYMLYGGNALYYAKELGASASGEYVMAVSCYIVFAFLVLLLLLVIGLNILALVLARRAKMDKGAKVAWWLSIAWCIFSSVFLTFPYYVLFEIGDASRLIILPFV